MMTVPFIDAVQYRVARIACGASATRGQGAGVVKAGQEFLGQLSLNQFAISRHSLFEQRLEDATQELCAWLPYKSRSWGLARKVLNIFLRDTLYTSYLSDKYRLSRAEYNFEIPLDSITTQKLRKLAGRGSLTRWYGVKHLIPETNKVYQSFATEVALNYGIARVHLDTFWWGLRADD